MILARWRAAFAERIVGSAIEASQRRDGPFDGARLSADIGCSRRSAMPRNAPARTASVVLCDVGASTDAIAHGEVADRVATAACRS